MYPPPGAQIPRCEVQDRLAELAAALGVGALDQASHERVSNRDRRTPTQRNVHHEIGRTRCRIVQRKGVIERVETAVGTRSAYAPAQIGEQPAGCPAGALVPSASYVQLGSTPYGCSAYQPSSGCEMRLAVSAVTDLNGNRDVEVVPGRERLACSTGQRQCEHRRAARPQPSFRGRRRCGRASLEINRDDARAWTRDVPADQADRKLALKVDFDLARREGHDRNPGNVRRRHRGSSGQRQCTERRREEHPGASAQPMAAPFSCLTDDGLVGRQQPHATRSWRVRLGRTGVRASLARHRWPRPIRCTGRAEGTSNN